MQLKFRKSIWVIGSIVLLTGIILWTPPFFFIKDQTLLSKVGSSLEQSVAENGLKLNIRNLRWERWNRLAAREIRLSDKDGRAVPFAFEKLIVKVNFFSLLRHRQHPEAALQEVILVNPFFRLERYLDGTWNWQRYFKGSGRKMHFQTILRMAGATLQIRDARYGTYTLSRVDGTVDLKDFPVAYWDLRGKLDNGDGFPWATRGEMDTQLVIGKGAVHFKNASLEHIRPFWPSSLPYRIYSGDSSGDIRLSWNKKGVWIEDGRVAARDAILNVSGFSDPVTVKTLQARFSPEQVRIGDSELRYRNTAAKFSGVVHSKTAAFSGDLKIRSLDLDDLAGVVPFIKDYRVSGKVDLKLHGEGTVGKPVFNGRIAVNMGRLAFAGRDIENITGRFKLSHNDLSIERFDGNYRKAKWSVGGRIRNILKPQYQLHIAGSRMDLNEFSPQLADLELATDATTDFKGEITGRGFRPVLSGEVALKRLAYREYTLDNPALQFAWSFHDGTIQIKKWSADVENGHFDAKGKVLVTSETVAWDLSGQLSEVNLADIAYLHGGGFSGTVSADAVIRGKWQKGDAFNIGSVFGVFKGKNLTSKGIAVDSAQAVYTWQDGRFRLDSIQGNVGQGRIFGSLMWSDSELLANLSVEDVRLQSLLNHPEPYPVDGLIKGNITIEGPIDNLKGKMVGHCDRVSWISHDIGSVDGEIVYTDKRFKIALLDLSSRAGDFRVRGDLGLDQNAPLNLNLTGDGINLKELAGWFPIDKTLALNGEGRVVLTVDGSLAVPKYRGTIDLAHPQIKNFTMDYGHAEFEGDSQTLRIKEVQMAGERSFIRLFGVIDREKLNLEYDGHLDEIEQLGLYYKGNITRGAVSVSGRINGSPEKPVVTAEVRGEHIGLGNFNEQYLAAQLSIKYPAIQIESLRLTGKDGDLEAIGNINLAQPAQLDLEVKGAAISAEKLLTTLKINHIPAGGKLSGSAQLNGTVTHPLIKAQGNFTDGFINQLAVNGEFQVEYSQNNLQIQKVELKHGSGILLMNGVWENGDRLKLNADLFNFPLQTLDLITHYKSEASGTINAELQLEWSKSGVSGDYRCEISDLAIHQNQLGNLAAKGSYTETGVMISDCKLATNGGGVLFNGYLPWPVQFVKTFNLPVRQNLSRDIAMQIQAHEVPVEVLNIWPDSFSLAKGRINGSLQLSGTFENPVISGLLEGNSAQLNLPTVPLVAENIQLAININANHVNRMEATGNIQKGKFSISGTAELEKLMPAAYSLAANGSNIYYKNAFFDGYGNLKIDVTGSYTKTLLAGEISVKNCRIGISGNHNHNRKPSWIPEFDLTIKAGKNVRYRQIGIADVNVEGEIRVKGSSIEPKLSGKVISDKGVLTLYGQNFIVQRGLAAFKPEFKYLPYVEVESSLKTPKAEIFLTVKGQVGVDFMTSLTSQPYLSQEEIYTLLNWPELNGEQPTINGMIGGNLSFVTDSLFGNVFNGVRNTLHLDYLYLETNYTENEFRINMGDYVTDQLFVSYSRSLIGGEPKEDWGFDYHLTPELVIGGTYSLEDRMVWKMTYGFRFK